MVPSVTIYNTNMKSNTHSKMPPSACCSAGLKCTKLLLASTDFRKATRLRQAAMMSKVRTVNNKQTVNYKPVDCMPQPWHVEVSTVLLPARAAGTKWRGLILIDRRTSTVHTRSVVPLYVMPSSRSMTARSTNWYLEYVPDTSKINDLIKYRKFFYGSTFMEVHPNNNRSQHTKGVNNLCWRLP